MKFNTSYIEKKQITDFLDNQILQALRELRKQEEKGRINPDFLRACENLCCMRRKAHSRQMEVLQEVWDNPCGN